jgi:hypothetical protein
VAVTKSMRTRILKRDNNQCWHCGEVEAISLQHRRNRQMGGSNRLDRADNLMVLCSAMNGLIESDAGQASIAKDFGWKLSSWDDFSMPVYNANDGKWYELHTDCTKTEVNAPSYLI